MAVAMTYPPYDTYGMSRRQSLGYPQTIAGYPFDQNQMYNDQMLGEYPHPSYQIYGPPTAPLAMSHALSMSGAAYDDLALRDGYYDGRMSAPLTPMIRPRHRRHSTVSFSGHAPLLEAYRFPSSTHIKFKRKGAFMAGISLAEAQGHVRLSSNDAYSLYDLHADRRGTVLLKVKWSGYASLTYEIPLDTYDSRISLATLARRVARACVHYLQANIINYPIDRIELHHLEEVSYGVWQPMLATR